jgi:hypothetical protein
MGYIDDVVIMGLAFPLIGRWEWRWERLGLAFSTT